MKILLYWVFFVVWLASVIGRIAMTVVPVTYFARYAKAHWGMRFFEAHVIIEALLVLGLGILVHFFPRFRSSNRPYFFAGLIAALAALHFGTMELEIGYQEHAIIGDQMHVVDWRFDPSTSGITQNDQALHITLFLPGMLPIYAQKPREYLRLKAIKTTNPELLYAFKFVKPDREKGKCIEEPSNTYCRFFHDGYWYFAHHQNFEASKNELFPSLKQLQQELPAVFASFLETDTKN